jgi:hypothetical protein
MPEADRRQIRLRGERQPGALRRRDVGRADVAVRDRDPSTVDLDNRRIPELGG